MGTLLPCSRAYASAMARLRATCSTACAAAAVRQAIQQATCQVGVAAAVLSWVQQDACCKQPTCAALQQDDTEYQQWRTAPTQL